MNFEELKDTIFNLVDEWNSTHQDGKVGYMFITWLVRQLEKRIK